MLKLLCLSLACALLIYICYERTIAAPDNIAWSKWAFSDWLINYQGGFVRRGLAGHIIGLFSAGQSSARLVNEIVFVSFSVLAVLQALLLLLSKPISPFLALLIILIPGGLWGMQFGNQLYYRKEIFAYVYVAGICLIYLSARRISSKRLSCWLDAFNCCVVVCLSLILSFVHEAFLFVGAVPSMIVIYWIALVHCPRWRYRAPLCYGAAITATFLVLLMCKGNAQTANDIWASLSPGDRAIISGSGEISGGISAIGWSAVQAVGETALAVLNGTAWYNLFAILVSFVYLMIATRFFRDNDTDNFAAMTWVAKIYALCLAGILPLFILGADWGRWVAAVNMAAVPLICAGAFKTPLPVQLSIDRGKFVERFKSARYSALILVGGALIVIGATFKVPECCLVGSEDGFVKMERHLFNSTGHAILGHPMIK